MASQPEKKRSLLRNLLEVLGYNENQIRILEAVAMRRSTALEISGQTGIPRPHVHSYMKQLRQQGVVQETKYRPKRYGLSLEALTKKLDKTKADFKETLAQLEGIDVESMISSIQSQIVEKEVQTIAHPPIFLSNTREFHNKAAYVLSKSTDVIIGTNWPFPWLKEYQIDKKPPLDVKDYWAEHNLFLERTKAGKSENRILYIVDTVRFVELLNRRDLHERVDSIRAIISCIHAIKSGYHMDFLAKPREGPRPTLTTFIVGRDSGFFAVSMATTIDFVLYGLFFEHPALAHAYGEYVDMLLERMVAYGLATPTDRLRKIAETVLAKARLPSKKRKELEKEYQQEDD